LALAPGPRDLAGLQLGSFYFPLQPQPNQFLHWTLVFSITSTQQGNPSIVLLACYPSTHVSPYPRNPQILVTRERQSGILPSYPASIHTIVSLLYFVPGELMPCPPRGLGTFLCGVAASSRGAPHLRKARHSCSRIYALLEMLTRARWSYILYNVLVPPCSRYSDLPSILRCIWGSGLQFGRA
jgi:hypothetical protein